MVLSGAELATKLSSRVATVGVLAVVLFTGRAGNVHRY